MDDHRREQITEFLGTGQSQIATFARQGYAVEGRGVVLVEAPELPPHQGTRLIFSHMEYRPVQAARELTANLEETHHEDRDTLLRMIDTYDPATEFVVAVVFGDGDGVVSVKMRLEPQTTADDPGGFTDDG